MSMKPPLKFNYIPVTRRLWKRHGLLAAENCIQSQLAMLGMNPVRGRRNTASAPALAHSPSKWQLHLDIERTMEDKRMSLPLLMYLYVPWKVLSTKLNLWQLKIFWDWQFVEKQFVNNAKLALVLVTKFILDLNEDSLKKCTTPMGYKQIKHDLVMSESWPYRLIRFERRHILRALPIKVQRLEHYDHKFAFVDVVFLAYRRSNDFNTTREKRDVRQLIDKYGDINKLVVPHPIIFGEFFVRFRRDYSTPPTEHAGHWLISTYKILKLDVLNFHPDGREIDGKMSIISTIISFVLCTNTNQVVPAGRIEK